jgi:Flp pilus assembly protein CpaB
VATEVKQRNNRVVVLVGAAIALVAFGLSLYVSHSGGGNAANTGQTVPVAVAKVDLLQGAQITPDEITVVPYPATQVPVGSSPDGSSLLSKFLAVGVSRNQPLTGNLLVADANSARTAALTVQPLDIHPGYVAMAIPLDGGGATADKSTPDQVSVGLWIQPEDHIDAIINGPGTGVRYAFQDLRVLKVGDQASTGSTGGGGATVFVVEVPRAQAEELAYLINPKTDAQGQTGGPHIIAYVLRGIKDKGAGYLDIADPSVPAKKDQSVTAQTFNALFPSR